MAKPAAPNEAAFYLTAARTAPLLDRAEEAELSRRWQAHGDRRAANALARSHQRQVVALALRYRRYGVPLGDLVAEGNVGVVHALAKFQPERGVRFGTYANYWIRAQMLAHVVKQYSSVGGSDGPMRSQMFFKLRKERARVGNLLGTGEAAERELAQRLGVTVERVREMVQRLDSRDVSLEAKSAGGAPGPVEHLCSPDDQEHELGQREQAEPLRRSLLEAVAGLDPRERYIAEQRLMADPEEELSLAEIARRLRVSRERVRQLELRTKHKLRRSLASQRDPIVKEWIARETAHAP